MNKIVVWGGPHPTVLPLQTLENEYVDAVVIGEGEISGTGVVFSDLNSNGKLESPVELVSAISKKQ
jgi:radical SAM superfamily enzyme YgiQ (UPF0313 family)